MPCSDYGCSLLDISQTKRIDNRFRRAGEWVVCISQVMLLFYRQAIKSTKVKRGFERCETDLLTVTPSQMKDPDHVTLFNPTDCGAEESQIGFIFCRCRNPFSGEMKRCIGVWKVHVGTRTLLTANQKKKKKHGIMLLLPHLLNRQSFQSG